MELSLLPTPMPVNPIVPQLQPQERADLLQWAETERAAYLADTLAAFAFGTSAVMRLSPEHAATCLRLAALGMRSTKPEWIKAALEHAADVCEQELRSFPALELCCTDTCQVRAEQVTVKVIQAYLGILDGSIVLPADVYLSISRDKVL